MGKNKHRPAQKHQPEPSQERYSRKKDKRKAKVKKEPLIHLSQIPYAFIILVYIFVVTFTPNWMALDTNAPKFMTLSFVNLLSFIYLVTRPDIKGEPGILMRFFDTKIGLVYGAFMVVVLLSFTQAINILESVLQFTKLFSVFTAVFIISVILMRDSRYVKMVVVVGALLLIFDSVSVYYYIGEFINRNISRITDIKSVYSNKNILASAIFVKMPFALYLWMFDKGRLKKIGLFSLFTAMLATWFLATRGFYLGLIFISVVFTIYVLVDYFRDRDKELLWKLGGYMGAFLLSLAIFSIVQSNLYPQIGRHTQPVGTQLATIQRTAQSSNRVDSWFWSVDMIRDNPFLGIGAGNWKINILEYENQQNTGYIYLYKAHNDFLETTVETGIIGGLLYLLIFVFVFWNLLRAYLNRRQKTLRYRHLFLAATGLLFYSFDAFFNFPIDRPEIQMLFALYVAIGIATALKPVQEAEDEKQTATAFELETGKENRPQRTIMARILSGLFIVLMLGSAYVLYLNFESSKLQRVIYQDIMRGQLDREPEMFMKGFPDIPNVSIWGESINSTIARYLLEEERNREVIDLLMDDRDINPFDGRREFFMAMAFNNLGIKDSALIYTEKAYAVKPHYFRNVHLMTTLMQELGRTDEVAPILEAFLAHDNSDVNAYLYTTSFLHRQGDTERAWQHIDTAYQRLSRDERIQQQHTFLQNQLFVLPHQHIFQRAAEYYNNQQYAEALPYLEEFIEKTPFQQTAYRMRAFSHYHLGMHEACIAGINETFELGERDPSLVNLRGVCLRALGDHEAACEDFREAMEAGVQSGIANYRNFCNS